MKLKARLSCKLGCAINADSMEKHKALILKEFNSVTFENALKFNYRIKSDLSYDFEEADKLYKFATDNHLAVRGHCLIWHIDFPENILGALTKEELVYQIRRYAKEVARRYPNIYAWDVVNEVYSMRDEGLRNTEFKKILGDDYIVQCFKIAREEFGNNVELYYNEEDEWFPKQMKGILTTAKSLLKNNAPIDGIGLQCHISCYEDLSHYRELLNGIRQLGLKCQITEMEVSVYDFDKGSYLRCPTDILEKQARIYTEMFNMFDEFKDIITLINFWSISDAETWRDHWPVENRKDWPTLFDGNDEPKPAYYRILEVLKQ